MPNYMHLIRDVDAEGGGQDYLLKNEIFGPGLSFKYFKTGNDPAAFFEKTVPFANDKIFGSLSCSVAIHPKSLSALGKENFDKYVCQLNWGTVGINVWAGFMPANPYGTWGAPPGRHDGELCKRENLE